MVIVYALAVEIDGLVERKFEIKYRPDGNVSVRATAPLLAWP